jgi:hypothetical protein
MIQSDNATALDGGARFRIKRAAGWTEQRPDGSRYAERTDQFADEAESFFTELVGGIRSTDVYLHGDPGYDVVVLCGSVTVKVDVVHGGIDNTDRPRLAPCHLIVNTDSKKLTASEVLVLVIGPPWALIGAVSTARFKMKAERQRFGHGVKLAMWSGSGRCSCSPPTCSPLASWDEVANFLATEPLV